MKENLSCFTDKELSCSCCFTGHRFVSYTDNAIRQAVLSEVQNLLAKNINTFYVGGALGFDMIAALMLASMKAQGKDLKLIFVLPSRDYNKHWKLKDQATLEAIMQYADDVVYITDKYNNGCMHERNRYMVDRCLYCITYIRNLHSGTGYTVGYARKNNRIIIQI